jgi:hypothetical protein
MVKLLKEFYQKLPITGELTLLNDLHYLTRYVLRLQ